MNNRCEKLIDSYRILCNRRSYFNFSSLNKDSVAGFEKNVLVMRVVLRHIRDEIDKNQLKLRNDIAHNFGYSYVGVFRNGFAKVINQERKENICDENGNLIFDEWVNDVDAEKCGYIRIRKDDKYNYFDVKNNKLLFEEFKFDYCGDFENGYAIVKDEKGYNFIDLKGNLICDGAITDFPIPIYRDSGLFEFEKHGKNNFMCSDGSLLFEDGYSFVTNVFDGVVGVFDGKCFNIFDVKTKKFVRKFDDMCDLASDYGDGCFSVKKGKKYNYFDMKTRKYLFKKWEKYNTVSRFHEGFAFVKKDDKWKCIKKDGSLLSNEDFYIINDFQNGYARVKTSKGFCLLKSDGTIFMNNYFDEVCNFENGFTCVQKNGKWRIVDSNGKYLFDGNIYFDKYSLFNNKDGISEVFINGEYNFIDLKKRRFIFSKNIRCKNISYYNGVFSILTDDLKFIYIDKNGEKLFN